MDPEAALHGDIEEGAAESTFERSLRLRQIALQASQAAILESRIARANRSRPQRLRVEDLVPGTTTVEIFREDGSGQGWRGPATILKIDEEAGNAVVDFQGKPYLLGLRHVRPLRDSFHIHFNTSSSTSTVADAEKAITAMKEVVESSTPYRPFTMGEVYIENNNEAQDGEVSQDRKSYNQCDAEQRQDLSPVPLRELRAPRHQVWQGHENHHGTSLLQRSDDHMARRILWHCHHRAQLRCTPAHQGVPQPKRGQALSPLLLRLCVPPERGEQRALQNHQEKDARATSST